MTRKLLIIALIFVIAGLVLVVYSDPIFRAISGAPSPGFIGGSGGNSTIFLQCRTVTNESIQQCLSHNGITFSGLGRGSGTVAGSAAVGSNSIVEGMGGIVLIGFGSILILIQIFNTPGSHSSIRRYKT